VANRTFIDKQYVMLKRRIELYAAVSVGAAGAVTLQSWKYPTLGSTAAYVAAPLANALPTGNPYPNQYGAGAEGVRSVVRTGTGLWTVTLQDNYQRVLEVGLVIQKAGGLSTIMSIGINSTLTNMAAQGGSVIALALLSATGTVADPANGDLVLVKFGLADATEP
jgi:hypothetical protein